MDIYVINLETRPQRLEHMKRQLGHLGLGFERFVAVDGAALVAATSPHPTLSPGAYGCLLSHLAVFRKIADGTAPFALLLEDDVYLSPATAEVLAHVDDWVPGDADLVKMESFEGETHLALPAAGRHGHFEVNELLSRHMGTGGYLVSRAAAARLAELDPRAMRVSIDALLFDPKCRPLPGLRIYQFRPAIVIQDARTAGGGELGFVSDTDADIRLARAERDSRRGALRRATRGMRHAFRRWCTDLGMQAKHGFGRVLRTRIPFDEG
jgi:glycosyl transferase family 25